MKPSRTRWVTNDWPLVNARLRRSQCVEIIQKEGIAVPKKSSCVFCPYHSHDFWQDLKQNHPVEFDRAVEFDRNIRDMSKSSIDSSQTALEKNSDGSVDVYFGPKAPAGKEGNWIPTAEGRRFFLLFRFYGPKPGVFDGSFELNDIELVK